MTEGTPAALLDELRGLRDDGRLAAVVRPMGVRLLMVFGSVLDTTSPRDLDLAVIVAPGKSVAHATGALLGWLRSDLVDVMDLASADVVARYEALAKGELLWTADPTFFAEEHARAVTQLADTTWLRELQLRVLAR